MSAVLIDISLMPLINFGLEKVTSSIGVRGLPPSTKKDIAEGLVELAQPAVTVAAEFAKQSIDKASSAILDWIKE